jgi:ElaA protein
MAHMNISWIYKPFNQLTPHELYAILQLRNEVFVVEQNCVFQDADNKDEISYHVMGWQDDHLAAYTRLVPEGVAYEESSIGRVVTSPKMRNKGLGRELMLESINILYSIWGKKPIKIGAQLYLKSFYESFGFQQTSKVYLEDGIEHIEMLLKIPS